MQIFSCANMHYMCEPLLGSQMKPSCKNNSRANCVLQCHWNVHPFNDAENVNLFILGFNLFSLFYSLTHTKQGHLFNQ